MILMIQISMLLGLSVYLLYHMTQPEVMVVDSNKVGKTYKCKIENGTIATKTRTWTVTKPPLIVPKLMGLTNSILYIATSEGATTLGLGKEISKMNNEALSHLIQARVVSEAMKSAGENRDKYMKYVLGAVICIVVVVALFVFFGTPDMAVTCTAPAENITRVVI